MRLNFSLIFFILVSTVILSCSQSVEFVPTTEDPAPAVLPKAEHVMIGGEAVTAIAITAPDSRIAAGTTLQFNAQGTNSKNGAVDITHKVTWSSSDTSKVTIDPATGIATALKKGSAKISASYLGLQSNISTLDVYNYAHNNQAQLQSINITSPTPLGLTAQLNASAHYSIGADKDVTTAVAWLSSDTGIAEVNSAGKVTGKKAGKVFISATYQGVTSNSSELNFYVLQVPKAKSSILAPGKNLLQSIQITTSETNIAPNGKAQFSVQGNYIDGPSHDLSQLVKWSASDPSIATIDDLGTVTGVKIGAVNITATYLGITSNNVKLTVYGYKKPTKVLQSITIINPSPQSIAAGFSVQFLLEGRYSDSSKVNIKDGIAWHSSIPGAASINSSGLAIGLATGESYISATYLGLNSNNVKLTVTQYSKFAYVLNAYANLISIYGISDISGELKLLKTIATDASPAHLIMDKEQQHIYVTNKDANNISQYNRNVSTGLLTPMVPAVVKTGRGPTYLVSDSKGQCVYAINQKDSSISMYKRDNVTGGLTSVKSPTIPISPVAEENNIVIRPPAEDVLYVPSSLSHSIASFRIDSTGCDLTSDVAQTAQEDNSFFLAFTPLNSVNGFYGYLTSYAYNAVNLYSLPAGSVNLNPVANAEVRQVGYRPAQLTFDPFGNYAYVLKSADDQKDANNTSSVLKVNPQDGTLTLSSRIPSEGLGLSSSIAFDSAGKYAYITKPSLDLIMMYSVNTDGSLKPLPAVQVSSLAHPVEIMVTN